MAAGGSKQRETAKVSAAGRKVASSSARYQWRWLTERGGVMFGENLVLGSVGVEEEEVVEVADAVGQRADGEVFGRVGHQVPHHPLTWRQQHQHQQLVNVNEGDNCFYTKEC